MSGMHNALMQIAVAATLTPPRPAPAAEAVRSLRKLTVTLTVEAQAADDSPLGPLVVEALQEFIDAAPGDEAGKFETRAGLDVSWRCMNRRYEDGRLIGVIGTDESGRHVDTLTGR